MLPVEVQEFEGAVLLQLLFNFIHSPIQDHTNKGVAYKKPHTLPHDLSFSLNDYWTDC